MPKKLPVKLTAQGERHVRSGHPWIFSDSIAQIKGEGEAGDLAIIFDRKKDKFLGAGLFDPDSPIRIKVLFNKKPKKVDANFFEMTINNAYQLRKELWSTNTNSYRLIHGENDGLPSLIVDVYDSVIVLKIYSLIWQPWLPFIRESLINLLQPSAIVLRLSRNVEKAKSRPRDWINGKVVHGYLEDPEVLFTEHGVTLSANVIRGHKTGFFLDHRNNRKRVGELSKGLEILDIFSYAGGFSAHALVGGAKAVTSLDISPQALEVAKKNVLLNVADERHQTICGDAFEELVKLQAADKSYDLIIVDPPSFAKRADEVQKAKNAYTKLTELVIPIVKKGGFLLLASCSSRVSNEEFLAIQNECLNRSQRPWKCIDTTGHDIDHPVSFEEGRYLKTMYVKFLD